MAGDRAGDSHVTPRLAHLYALRAHLDAVIAEYEAELGLPAEQKDPAEWCPSCGAGPEYQKNVSTLDGVRRVFCTRCQTERTVT